MKFNWWQIKVVSFFLCYLVPIVSLIVEIMLKGNELALLITIIDIGIVIYLIYRCNQWELGWFPLRQIYIIAYIGITIYKLFSNEYGSNIDIRNYFIIVGSSLCLLVLSYLLYKVVLAIKQPKNCMELRFPYGNGTYLISDGGDGFFSSLVNYHYKSMAHTKYNTQASMRYAVDIVKMNRYGTTAKTILRRYKEDYESYGENVYCPLEGKIVKVVDGIADNDPFPGMKKLSYNVGNRVVIKNGDYYLVIGHFKNRSIVVKEGEQVKKGDFLGCSGCSGLSPRPEMHIQLMLAYDEDYWHGEGVPIIFEDNIYPTKNRIIHNNPANI